MNKIWLIYFCGSMHAAEHYDKINSLIESLEKFLFPVADWLNKTLCMWIYKKIDVCLLRFFSLLVFLIKFLIVHFGSRHFYENDVNEKFTVKYR